MIAGVVQALPRDAAGLIIGALAGDSLKLGSRVGFGVVVRFLQAAVPQGAQDSMLLLLFRSALPHQC
ncbi:MAG: hypothetical protein WCC92_18445, partial [Candidatus Korobacteraceae bacterium]